MSIAIETLFTTALGLQPPWHVAKVELDTGKRRIDFEVEHTGKREPCPACGAVHQPVHDRVRRSWRHLDFFQFEAWLHAQVPRIACSACGKTTQITVPWAREGSGFTLLFEALALALCQGLAVKQAARMLRVRDKGAPAWRSEARLQPSCASSRSVASSRPRRAPAAISSAQVFASIGMPSSLRRARLAPPARSPRCTASRAAYRGS